MMVVVLLVYILSIIVVVNGHSFLKPFSNIIAQGSVLFVMYQCCHPNSVLCSYLC